MGCDTGWSQALVRWYGQNGRDLPWRRTRDPYAIWISEIMLQQTRVETAREYYRRFLARFPDVQTLASASEPEVLKLWEGLGYYSRARNMLKAAREIVARNGGRFPGQFTELLSLPGIGPYTAGAVASIAYGEAVPAVDGNVKRVASRLFGIREDIEAPASRDKLSRELAKELKTSDPGSLNQALMELGATLCTPRKPGCERCPVANRCDAFTEGDQESLPVHGNKRAAQTVEMAVCLLTFENKVLLRLREERLLQGLYVFELAEGETDPLRVLEQLRENGLNLDFITTLGKAKHLFTHRVWQMRLLHYRLRECPDTAWLTKNNAVMADARMLGELPLPTAMKAARQAAMNMIG